MTHTSRSRSFSSNQHRPGLPPPPSPLPPTHANLTCASVPTPPPLPRKPRNLCLYSRPRVHCVCRRQNPAYTNRPLHRESVALGSLSSVYYCRTHAVQAKKTASSQSHPIHPLLPGSCQRKKKGTAYLHTYCSYPARKLEFAPFPLLKEKK